jgi:flavin reductase (DIM6/NTAB) family NADH-FMN oxidoreductase RutF
MLRAYTDRPGAIVPAPAAAAGTDLRAAFVEGMSRSATPVYVVTTAGPAGTDGLTVSAVSAVSADPPMLLACIHRQSPCAGAVRRNGILAASLLAADQAALADVFAGRHPGRTRADSLAADPWIVGLTGAPLLESAAARFDCRLVTAYEAATHAILLALVLEVATSARDTLLYHGRRYTAPARPAAPQKAQRAELAIGRPGPQSKAVPRSWFTQGALAHRPGGRA